MYKKLHILKHNMTFILQDFYSTSDTVTLVIEPSHTIGYCHVPKVASSTWMLAFAKMNGLIDETNQCKSSKIFNYSLVI